MAISTYIYPGGVLTAGASVQGAAVPALTRRIITAAVLTNATAGAVSCAVYLVKDANAPDATSIVISSRILGPNESYFCPELINQGIGEGGTVQALGAGVAFRYTAKDIVNG